MPDDLQSGIYKAFVELPLIETVQTSHVEFTVKNESEEPEEPQNSVYEVIPAVSEYYDIDVDQDGICTLRIKDEVGFKHFAVDIKSVVEHVGFETVVFVHMRDQRQLELNAVKADFDIVQTVKSGFGVNQGDVIKIYVLDELTNNTERNPIIFH